MKIEQSYYRLACALTAWAIITASASAAPAAAPSYFQRVIQAVKQPAVQANRPRQTVGSVAAVRG